MNIKNNKSQDGHTGWAMFGLFIIICLLASCSKKQEPKPTIPTTAALVGTWHVTQLIDFGGDAPDTLVLTDCQKTAVWTYKNDTEHTSSIVFNCSDEHNFNGTYKFSHDTLYMWNADDNNRLESKGPVTFSNSNNTMVYDDNAYGGFIYTLERIDH